MPSPFGTGEIVTRLRKSLDLRGKFPMSIDETLVPMILVADATQLPYRVSGRRWWGVCAQAAIVASNSLIEIRNTSSFVQKLDRLTYLLNTAVGAGTQQFQVQLGVSAVGSVGTVQATTSEIRIPPPAVTEQVGIQLIPDQGNPTALTVRQLATPVLAILQDASVEVEDLDLAIPPGCSVYVRCVTQQQAIQVSASGRFFDDVPRIAG